MPFNSGDFCPNLLPDPYRRYRRAPALGGAAYTCKDLAESLAGKDRYEFEKFFGTATALTLSKSVFRFIDTRQMISV